MIIRKKQQNQVAVDLFIERLKRHWLDNFAPKFSALSGDEIHRLAQKALREAQAKGIEKEDEIVVYCHHGIRSAQAVGHLRALGFTKAYNLAGGIDRWTSDIDPRLPRY